MPFNSSIWRLWTSPRRRFVRTLDPQRAEGPPDRAAHRVWPRHRRAADPGAFESHWFPYDRVGVV